MENYIEVQEALDLWKAQFSEDKEQDLPEDVTVCKHCGINQFLSSDIKNFWTTNLSQQKKQG